MEPSVKNPPVFRSQITKFFVAGLVLLNLSHATLASQGEVPAFDHSHALWHKVLKRFVSMDGRQSKVNYSALKKEQGDLDTYLVMVQKLSLAEFSGFTQNQKLSFLINAYNALTVKLILDHYPVKSIRDIGGIFSSPWKIKFFTLFGEKHRLDDIEHEMIRKTFQGTFFNEPRIHFALVCASKGCPALLPEAFVADKLEAQLEKAVIAFLTDTSRNRFERDKGTIFLSSIFKWYGEDFEKKFGSVKAFIAPKMAKDKTEEALLKSVQTKVAYLDYDWTLNE